MANAVEDAIGVRITDLPLTPEKVFDAIQQARKAAAKAPKPIAAARGAD